LLRVRVKPAKSRVALLIADFVMHGRPRRMRCLNPIPNFHRLHRLQRHDRRSQQRIEPLVPLHVAAKTGRNIVRHYLEHSAHRIARAQNFIHFFFHALLGIGVGARKQHFVLARQWLDLLPGNFPIRNRNRATAIT
jgi:hypothetical protein